MAGKWIQEAIRKKGALRAQLGTPAGRNIPVGQLQEAASAPGTLGRRARLAVTLRKLARKRKQ